MSLANHCAQGTRRATPMCAAHLFWPHQHLCFGVLRTIASAMEEREDFLNMYVNLSCVRKVKVDRMT